MSLQAMKSAIPLSIKTKVFQLLKFQRFLTGRLRLLPDFIIIGGQRCGTTTLYRYLSNHPSVIPSSVKEVHFFDKNYAKGVNWYRANFPYFFYKTYLKHLHKKKPMTGEATPYYIFHPHVPRRISELTPATKLILLLRNPVDRAYSHYSHEVRNGNESLSFVDALEREEERLCGEVEKMLADENYYSFNHQHYTYLSRGIYVDQLKIWEKYFPKEQILSLKSEDFYENTAAVFEQVLRFLELPMWEPKAYKNYNYANNSSMDGSIRNRLIDYFEPHNQKLYEYLGKDLQWDN